MLQNETQTDVANLANIKTVKILALISIACVPTCMGAYIGIILAAISLVLGNKAQESSLTEHPDPQSWKDCSPLLKYMIYATIGFILNALVVATSFNPTLVRIINGEL